MKYDHAIYEHFKPDWEPFDAPQLKPGVTGIVPGRNIIELDYCAELAVKSLLPVCDEVIFCDSDSTDGTTKLFKDWAANEPKLRVINYRWPNPCGDLWLLPKWINFAREQARFESCVQLDADEVMHPRAYPIIRKNARELRAQYFHRFNFWGDAHHLAPHNTVCAQYVVRQGPTHREIVSDGHYNPEPWVKRTAFKPTPDLMIYHLGFLRKNEAFFKKTKVVQPALVNTIDQNILRAEADGKHWAAYSPFKEPLIPFKGDHPPGCVEWLNDRGL